MAKKVKKQKKGIKKAMFCGLFLLVLFMSVPSFAQDIINTPYGLGNLKGLNLQGDTLYLPSSGSFAVGAGTTLATIYHDTIEVRGEMVLPVNAGESTKYGVGIGVNIPSLISKLGGSSLIGGVNSSMGIEGLTDFNGKVRLEPAIYISLIKVGL